jgi:diadenosine tetraphosphate (Ap4A) HIT family hydrolase
LSPFPNTRGFSVVATKAHHSSDALAVPQDVFSAIFLAGREAAAVMRDRFHDVGRVGMILEGLGIDHLHIKLFPMHGTADLRAGWRPIKSNVDVYFEKYEGYISSHDYRRAEDAELREVQALLVGGGQRSDEG